MRSTRRLALRRETLAELDGTEIAAVAGGSVHTFCTGCDTICEGYCLSLDRCPTVPARACLSLDGDPCIGTR